MDEKILGCYVSYPSLMHDATEEQRENARSQGDLFSIYIWGENSISNAMKELKGGNYGNNIKLILFQFYVNPMQYVLEHLKKIESYRKKEKSVGISIIVTDENFFNKSEKERRAFLKNEIMHKMELLEEVVKKKKLDTNMVKLKADLEQVLKEY